MRIKKSLNGIWMAWKIIVIVILSAILIPLAITYEMNQEIMLWIVAGSLLGYILLAWTARKVRGKIGKYLLGTGNRLLLAGLMLGISVTLFRFEINSWGRTSIIASAVLFAFFLQRISFLRVIGL